MDEKELKKIERKFNEIMIKSHNITCSLERINKEFDLINENRARLSELIFDIRKLFPLDDLNPF